MSTKPGTADRVFGIRHPKKVHVARSGTVPRRTARRAASSGPSRRVRGRVRRIVTLGSPDETVLHRRSRPVETVGAAVRTLIADLVVTMREARGVGLAAPQIGIPLRVLVADSGNGPIALVNPRVKRRWGMQVGQEGCLSIPGVVRRVPRAVGIEVDTLVGTGRRVVLRGTGFLARILQHEIDHLNGILILDRVPGPRRTRPRPSSRSSRTARVRGSAARVRPSRTAAARRRVARRR